MMENCDGKCSQTKVQNVTGEASQPENVQHDYECYHILFWDVSIVRHPKQQACSMTACVIRL